jgi:hypothetical protein
VDWGRWALFGLVATTALTAVMIHAQLAGLTGLAGRLLPATPLVRRLSVEGGPVDAVVEFDPRLAGAVVLRR